MFYVCKKRDDGTFGIFDTEDGVVEYYTPKEIVKFSKQFHIDIIGVSFNDGKMKITVQKPTGFEAVGSYNADDVPEVIESGFASEFKNLRQDNLRSTFIDHSGQMLPMLLKILKLIANRPLKLTPDDFQELDGWDCVGYEDVVTKDDSKKVSVYTNPEVKVRELPSGKYQLISATARGFGVDVYDASSGELIKHIDGSFQTWMEDCLSVG